jgi:AAA+ superfamily predicted ATPase
MQTYMDECIRQAQEARQKSAAQATRMGLSPAQVWTPGPTVHPSFFKGTVIDPSAKSLQDTYDTYLHQMMQASPLLPTNNTNKPMQDNQKERQNIQQQLRVGQTVVLSTPMDPDATRKYEVNAGIHPYFPEVDRGAGEPVKGIVTQVDWNYSDESDEDDIDQGGIYAVVVRWTSGGTQLHTYGYRRSMEERELFSWDEWGTVKMRKLSGDLVNVDTGELDKLILTNDAKTSILAVIKQHQHSKKIFEEWGLGEVVEYGRGMGMLFWGPPGTGKTWAAQCIGKAMGKKVNIIDNAKLQSSVPGEMERNLKAEFAKSKKDKSILMLDECDSLLMSRQGMGMILSSEINCLLTEIEKFEGIVILTTNRIGELDKALERRISLIVHFPAPDYDQRVALWKRFLPEKLPIGEGVKAEKLAEVELTGGLVKNVVLNAARLAVSEDSKTVELAHFERAVTMSEEGNKAFRKKSSVLHGVREAVGTAIRDGQVSKEVNRAVDVTRVKDEGEPEAEKADVKSSILDQE